MGLREEIFEQPIILRRWLETQLESTQRSAQAIRTREVKFVLLAGRGTSDHAGVYAQYVWGTHNRLLVALAAPSLFSLYEAPPRLEQTLVVGISQSGQSPDVVSVVVEGKRQGALTLAITNNPQSPLAQTAEFTLDLGAGPEQAVAATKTYTAELMAVAALSAAMKDDGVMMRALWRAPEAMNEALKLDPQVERMAAEHAALAQCVVLGRGYNYATAREWALKLKELAHVLADPYSTADFQHGPIASVKRGFPVLAVAPGGAVFAEVLSVLRRLRDEHDAELLVISDDDEALTLGRAALRLPAGAPEWLTPLVSIVPAQLYCYHLARVKGCDTEAPRGLRKVTRTR